LKSNNILAQNPKIGKQIFLLVSILVSVDGVALRRNLNPLTINYTYLLADEQSLALLKPNYPKSCLG
jgi:hypothetical protein